MAENFDSISVRGFAKEIGKSHVWVLKLLNDGILPRNEDGSIPLQDALKAYSKTQEGKDQRRDTRRKEQKDKTKHGKDQNGFDIEGTVNVNASLNKVKLAKETYNARLKELDYKARKGELLEKNEVCDEASKLAEALRGKLLAIPVRISGICEGRTAREIEEIVEDSINEALKEMQKCDFV